MEKKIIGREELFQYYIVENHTTKETAKHFMAHERTIRRRLSEFNITKSVDLQIEAWRRVHQERYGNIFVKSNYYKQNVKSHMVEKVRKTCQNKYGVSWVASLESTKEKAKQTFLQKYGKPYYTQTEECHHKSKRFYKYDGEMFDSSWELALWIYAKEHKEDIQRCPYSLEYYVEDKKHYYFPDFLYKGQLVEIKGDIYLNTDEQLVEFNTNKVTPLTVAKTRCMQEHNVVIYCQKDIQFALDYVFNKYGRTYLKSFQIRKK